MATQAEMLARLAAIPLNPDNVTLTETLQNDAVYWVLRGNYYETLPDGQKRILYPVEIIELKT